MITKNYFGTTTIELVLYMGLLTIFILILFDVFSQILSTQTRSVSISLVQTNGNFLLTKLTHDINQADSIIVPSAIGSTSTSITLQIGTTNATYAVTNGRLQLTDSSGTYNLNDVDTTFSDFLVQKMGNVGGKSGVQISFKIASNLIDNSATKSLNFNTFATIR